MAKGKMKTKQKTRKSLKGRVKITATGKVMYRSSGKRHLLNKKTAKRKSGLEKSKEVKDKTLQKTIKKLLCVS